MFTVKHISPSGNESLYSAYEVEFIPSEQAAQCFTRSPIEAAHQGGSLCLTKLVKNPGEIGTYTLGLEKGTVFVMNEHGKTVSRFDLGGV